MTTATIEYADNGLPVLILTADSGEESREQFATVGEAQDEIRRLLRAGVEIEY
jgi:hypothetical protein